MIRLGTLFWLVLVSATGFAMFGVKYQVQALEDELARTNRATAAEEHELRVLEAEWAYLTRPATLEAMNRQFLSLSPIATKQLHTTAADIPLRPPPPPAEPPPVEPPVVVAAAEPAPATSMPPSAPEGRCVCRTILDRHHPHSRPTPVPSVLRAHELIQPRHRVPLRHRDRVRPREPPLHPEPVQGLTAERKDVF